MKKVISPETKMAALAAFTMANQNYLRAEAYAKSMCELLGYSDGFGGPFGDEWLQPGADFESVFKECGFIVRKRKIPKSKRGK